MHSLWITLWITGGTYPHPVENPVDNAADGPGVQAPRWTVIEAVKVVQAWVRQ